MGPKPNEKGEKELNLLIFGHTKTGRRVSSACSVTTMTHKGVVCARNDGLNVLSCCFEGKLRPKRRPMRDAFSSSCTRRRWRRRGRVNVML
uniref:Uncharacterized protein n=1 Tax=Rhizophora mucronata TaxID=61149 RepID=A0A2P2J267_RHIMU